jgi:putative two-component system response regulator
VWIKGTRWPRQSAGGAGDNGVSAPRSTILAIDDTAEVRRLLEERLRESHLVKTAPDGDAALALAREPPLPDLILLDTKLAEESGYELCKALRALPGLAEVPVIFLAERRYAQDLVQAFRLDAIDFIVKPLSAPTIGAGIEARLEQIAHERSSQLQGSERRVARLVRAMQWHDSSLGGKRTRRLAEYARALGEAAGAREVARELLMRAAQLHDVGKLGVPAELLRKERTLSGAERELYERHAALGAEIIGEHDDALLKVARTIALAHHERWDGAGYPGRLQANQIPWAGRVMAIVDAFESMTAPQYGGFAISIERAVAEIGTAAGKQFDPALVEALREALPAFRQVCEAHAEQPADDDFMIGEAADGARRPAAPADDDFMIGEAADGARRPAAPADENLVIGAAAAGAVDESELTMIGPLPIRGESASTERLREAIQPTAAKAQAARRAAGAAPAELPAPTLENPVAAQAHAGERHRAEQGQLQAQIKTLSARVNELEAERGTTQAALAQAKAELDGARARVNELETERAAAVAALSQARAELSDLQRARRVEAGELARVGRERDVAEERHRREQSELHEQLESLRAHLKELEGERGITQAALAQAKVDLDGARARVDELETERTATVPALSHAAHQFEAQSELPRLGEGRAAAEERHWQERVRLQAQVETLRAQVQQVGDERAAAQERHDAEVATAEARRAEVHAALVELEKRRAAAESALAQLETRRRAAEAALGAEKERLRIAAEREAAEGTAAQAARRRAADDLAATEAANERQEAEERLSIILAAQAASRRQVAEAAERPAAASTAAAAAGATTTPAQGSHPLFLLVVFLLGGLAVAVTFVLGLYYL